MKTIALLISPLTRGAFYANAIEIAQREFALVAGIDHADYQQIGGLDFLLFSTEDVELNSLSRLSFVQGIFEKAGKALTPIEFRRNFNLHEDFVFGAKYRGKTNELLSQLLINLGMASLETRTQAPIKLLDPMCGRGTSLLWGLRYGMNVRGIEQEANALDETRQIIKKWCKLHRVKHKLSDGFIGKANKQGMGKFIHFESGDNNLRMITGDTAKAADYLKSDKFDLIVTDLPYGIQHRANQSKRNPLDLLAESASDWIKVLKKEGTMVIAFNSYIPKRSELLSVFTELGLIDQEVSIPHRMSESIVRDVVVLKK